MYYKQNLPYPFANCCDNQPSLNQNRPTTLPSFGGTPAPSHEKCENDLPQDCCHQETCAKESCCCGGKHHQNHSSNNSMMLILLLLFMK